MLEHVKTIYLDYDGTLHDSINIYTPAFQKAYDYLVDKGLAQRKKWTRDEISYWLGFNPEEMWKNFMPELTLDIKEQCSHIIGRNMELQLEQGKAVLYKGAIEILEYLKKKGYILIFLSNCKIYYKESQNKLFHLDKYFDQLICSEEYNYIPKYEILKQIRVNYPEEMVIVGDRMYDIEAGKKNRIYTIGCNYGYGLPGELDDAEFRINNINELKNFL